MPPKQKKRSRSRSNSPVVAKSAAEKLKWSVHADSVLVSFPDAKDIQHCFFRAKNTLAAAAAKGKATAPSSTICAKVAAFDLDDTVVTPKSGAVFAKDANDWMWLSSCVKDTLHDLRKKGYMIVIMSNQSGIAGDRSKGSWNESKAAEVKGRVENVARELGLPVIALMAAKEDEYRKPCEGMWDLLEEKLTELAGGDAKKALLDDKQARVDTKQLSFFVGDAAGRQIPTPAGRKKDFSCSDRKFAYNVGVLFFTPEEIFRADGAPILAVCERVEAISSGSSMSPQAAQQVIDGSRVGSKSSAPVPFDWSGVGPEELAKLPTSYENLTLRRVTQTGEDTITLAPSKGLHLIKPTQEMVFLMGYPGSGKSTIYQRFFQPHNYGHVNRDTLKTPAKCLATAESMWLQKKSIVIDNTSPSSADKQPYIDMVKKHWKGGNPLPIRIICCSHSKDMAMHMNMLRSRLGISARIGSIAYNMFKSKYEPITSEYLAKHHLMEMIEMPPTAVFDGMPAAALTEFYKLT